MKSALSKLPTIHKLYQRIGLVLDVVIIAPHPTTIGNTAEDIYFGLLKAKREGKKLLILRPYQLPYFLRLELTNVKVFNVQSIYILNRSIYQIPLSLMLTLHCGIFRFCKKVLPKYLLTLSEKYTVPMLGQDTLWQPTQEQQAFDMLIAGNYRWQDQLAEPIDIVLRREQKELAKKLRREMGISESRWFVCIHVRESGFWNDEQTNGSRNASIANYLLTIKHVTNLGGIVVRLGDASMRKLPVLAGVIDYPFTKYKSDLMDLYLIKECKFFIGMQSGILDIATLFQRPIVITNMTGWLFNGPIKKTDRGLLKHIYSLKDNRFLSIKEWLKQGWPATAFLVDESKYRLQENSATEILEVVKEFIDSQKTNRLSSQQIEYSRLRLIEGERILNESRISVDQRSDTYAKYRLASRLYSSLGVIGAKSLEKNWIVSESTVVPTQ